MSSESTNINYTCSIMHGFEYIDGERVENNNIIVSYQNANAYFPSKEDVYSLLEEGVCIIPPSLILSDPTPIYDDDGDIIGYNYIQPVYALVYENNTKYFRQEEVIYKGSKRVCYIRDNLLYEIRNAKKIFCINDTPDIKSAPCA